MTPEVSIFEFKGIMLRTVKIDGEPWFVATDIRGFVAPLGTTARMIQKLSPDQKDVSTLHTLGGPQKLTIVSESGLYDITLRAQKKRPQVREFQDWVTRDVLPAIRKDGAYVMGEEKVAAGEMSGEELVVRALEFMRGKLERLNKRSRVLPTRSNCHHFPFHTGHLPIVFALARLTRTS